MEMASIIASLTGLGGIILAFYSTYQESKYKLYELKIKEQQFKDNNKNQISKEKYQELFAEKIDLYKQLQEIISKFNKETTDLGRLSLINNDKVESLTIQKISFDLITDINNILDKKIFLLSSQLEKKYKLIHISFNTILNKHYQNMDMSDLSDPEMCEQYDNALNKFYNTNKDDINKFIKLIEKEIHQIKISIGFEI